MNNEQSESRSLANRLKEQSSKVLQEKVERRSFLKGAVAAGAAAIAPMGTANAFSFESFFQKHYREMSAEDKKKVFARIKREIQEDYGVEATLSDPAAIDGVKFVYALNLSKCNGSRKCVTACQKENNLPPDMAYITVLEMPRGTMNVEKGNRYYEGESVPKEGNYYLPVQCNHCENSPCTKVCPIEATWKEKDGVVVVDYDWCIGCRYCMAACPYEARHFNFKKPKLDSSTINPSQSYLSNRVRSKGVMEKCTFCLQRTREGSYPACLEACPTGARKFGNIYDAKSEVSQILKEKSVFVLKEELNTVPQFFYYFD
jgi:Fe-S-cluster-containing dehydrogenase component